MELKKLEALKIQEIQMLSQEINQEASKVTSIYKCYKQYRAVDLEMILDVCSRKGYTIGLLLQWVLANLEQQHWTSFLIAIVIAFHKEVRLDLLKQIINKTPLQAFESTLTKVKKPAQVSLKNWQTAQKLSLYGGNLKRLPQQIMRNQR